MGEGNGVKNNTRKVFSAIITDYEKELRVNSSPTTDKEPHCLLRGEYSSSSSRRVKDYNFVNVLNLCFGISLLYEESFVDVNIFKNKSCRIGS